MIPACRPRKCENYNYALRRALRLRETTGGTTAASASALAVVRCIMALGLVDDRNVADRCQTAGALLIDDRRLERVGWYAAVV